MPAKPFNYKSIVRGAVRRIWMWSPMRKEAIVNARVPGKPFKVACAVCAVTMRESVKPPLFAVDHVRPASEPAAAILDWNDFLDRLFIPANGLQILCHTCHDAKTLKENASRSRKSKAKRARRTK